MTAEGNSSLLFTPLKIRGVTLKNRIGVSPMCTYSGEDGFPIDWHLVHYGGFATAGAGLVVVEATGVEPRGRLTTMCLGIWKDEHIDAYRSITKFIKSQGSVPGIQLAHSGSKGSTAPPWVSLEFISSDEGGWETIGPSAIKSGKVRAPTEATYQDLEEIKQIWVDAAMRAVKAGFQVIELLFAHGFLVSSFMSPFMNQRSDKYGGSLENRMRLGVEIAEAVRKSVPEDFVVGARISVTDFKEGGWDIPQAVEFAREMRRVGLDFIDCSSGGMASEIKYDPVGWMRTQHEAAGIIQRDAGIMTAAVGRIIDPLFAENLLREKKGSFVLVGRAFMNNPHWIFDAADALASTETYKYIKQYDWCVGWAGYGQWRKETLQDFKK